MRIADVLILLVCLIAPPTVSAQTPAYGAASPQEVMAGVRSATASKDLTALVRLIEPARRRDMATELIEPMLMFVRMADPDDPMPGMPKLSPKELASKRQAYKGIVETITQSLKPYGLDSLVGKTPMAPTVRQTLDTTLPKLDTVALIGSLVGATTQITTSLGQAPNFDSPLPPYGAVTDYQITGDRATGMEERQRRLNFVRIAGRWYIVPPPGR